MRNLTEIIMILATAVVLVLFVIYDKYSEGFTNENSPRPPVTSCPQYARGKVTAYYDKKDVMCCGGKVTNNKCDSKPICTLGKPSGDIKSCADVMAEQFKNMSERDCPSKLPNAFMDLDNGKVGCTDVPVKANYRGPVRDSANKCNMYIKLNDKGELDVEYYMNNVFSQEDSCVVQRAVENLEKKCVGQDCIAFKRKIPSTNSLLIGLDFTDVDNVRRTCYDDDTYRQFIYKINKNGNVYLSPYREQLCSLAKQLYIDKGK